MQSGSHRAEIGKPFGWADTLCWTLSRIALENPVDGVSSHLNLLAFNRTDMVQTNSDYSTYSKDGNSKTEHAMPPVARSYSDLISMCKASGLIAESALC
jgi:hypothetical protein